MSACCTGKNSNGGRCFKAAAMCGDHTDNGSDVLIDWLKSHKIQFAVNITIDLPLPMVEFHFLLMIRSDSLDCGAPSKLMLWALECYIGRGRSMVILAAN